MAATIDLKVKLASGPTATVKVELETDAGALATARRITEAAKDTSSTLTAALSASHGMAWSGAKPPLGKLPLTGTERPDALPKALPLVRALYKLLPW